MGAFKISAPVRPGLHRYTGGGVGLSVPLLAIRGHSLPSLPFGGWGQGRTSFLEPGCPWPPDKELSARQNTRERLIQAAPINYRCWEIRSKSLSNRFRL